MVLQAPVREDQTDFNLRRWDEVMVDPRLAKIEGRVETDRHGNIVVMMRPGFAHGSRQSEISALIRHLMAAGRTVTECPVSTSDGVKGLDVAWLTDEQVADVGNRSCVPFAPAICVEVVSPSNTKAELDEKTALYFEAGAKEVWICEQDGSMRFLMAAVAEPAGKSAICPEFPARVELD